MENDDAFLLNIKKCKIYENSDNVSKSKSKSKLNINEKKYNILWKKKNENKSSGKKKRKRKGNKKKKDSLNKYSIALDLYQKQLKKNYKTLSSIQDITKSSTEIEVIEDKYDIFKKGKRSLSLPKAISNSYDSKNTPSLIPVLSKRDDIHMQNIYSNNSIIYQKNSSTNSNISDFQLNNCSNLSLLNISPQLKNSKKIIDFQKLIRRNPYDYEKHGNINYSKILKYISNNNLRTSSDSISILNNSNDASIHNISTKTNNSSENDNINSSFATINIDELKSKSINELKTKDALGNRENTDIEEMKVNKTEEEKSMLKKKTNDKYSSILKPKMEKQNIKMKSFHRNFYSKLSNFTKTDILYHYNNMSYKPLSGKDNSISNSYIKNREEPLSSIKIDNNVYYCSKNLLNSSAENIKNNNYKLNSSSMDESINKSDYFSTDNTKKQYDELITKKKKSKKETNKKRKDKTINSKKGINSLIEDNNDTKIIYYDNNDSDSDIVIITTDTDIQDKNNDNIYINNNDNNNNNNKYNNNNYNLFTDTSISESRLCNTDITQDLKENNTEVNNDINKTEMNNDINYISLNNENDPIDTNSYHKEKNNEDHNNVNPYIKNDKSKDNIIKYEKNDLIYHLASNNSISESSNSLSNNSSNSSINNNNDSYSLNELYSKPLITTKKLLSISKNKKDTILKKTVYQRPVSSLTKSASSLKNNKSSKSLVKKKTSTGNENNKNNNNDSFEDFELKKLRNDIVEIQELMSKSSQPVTLYSSLVSKNNSNIESLIYAFNNITELSDYQNVLKIMHSFAQISNQCLSYLSKMNLSNRLLKLLLKLNDEYQISRVNNFNNIVSLRKSSQKTLLSILHLIIENLLLLSTVEKRIQYSVRIKNSIPTVVGLIYLWNNLNQDKKVIQCFYLLNIISKNVNNVTELLSSTNILHIHKLYFQKWTKFSKTRNVCLLNLLQCFFFQKKFRKTILSVYSMNLILKIFLMEKDIANQKTLLKIIKCLILDEKGKQSFADNNGMKVFHQKIKSLPTGNMIEKNKNKKKIIELYLMMIDIIRSRLPKTSLPYNSSLKVWRFYDVSKLKLKSIDKDMNIRAFPSTRIDISNVENYNNSNIHINSISNGNSDNNSYNCIYSLSSNLSIHSTLHSINDNISTLFNIQKEMDNENTSFIIDKKDLSQFFPERQFFDNDNTDNPSIPSSSSNLTSQQPINTIKTLGATVNDISEPLIKRNASSIRYILLSEVNKYISQEKHPTNILVYDKGNDSIAKSFTSEPNILKFDSNFESGNLELAVKVCDNEYDLYLQSDINVDRGQHNQWFFFSVSKMVPNVVYKFNIINMTKAYSQFKSGMQPLQYSSKEKVWRRNGSHVDYYKNNYIRTKGKKKYFKKNKNGNKSKNDEEEKSENGSNDNNNSNQNEEKRGESNEEKIDTNPNEVKKDNLFEGNEKEKENKNKNMNENKNEIENRNENESKNENENENVNNDNEIEIEIEIENESNNNENEIEIENNDNDIENENYNEKEDDIDNDNDSENDDENNNENEDNEDNENENENENYNEKEDDIDTDNDNDNEIVNENDNDNDDNDLDNDIENDINKIEKEIEDNEKNAENDNNYDSEVAYEDNDDDNDEENTEDDNDEDTNNSNNDKTNKVFNNDGNDDNIVNNSKTIKENTTDNDEENENVIEDKDKNESEKESTFYYSTLSFSAYTPYENDCVYFSYHYPYTYSDLQRYLNSLIKEVPKSIIQRQTLCQTIMGNDCDLLTITDFENENKKMDKPYILLTGRVHPGESNSSFILEGLIDFLVSSHPKAVFLRQNVIFKIVPMLNPDGVILGNQRCNLVGLDLNRQWSENKVSSKTSPTIYWTKSLWNYIIDEKNGLGSKVLLYCDFHGHSRKKNIFLYGCELEKSEIVGDITEKTFPNQMSNYINYFDIDSCKYVIEDYKKSTARVVGYQELKTYYSYTLECSFAGYENKLNKREHYHPKHLKQIGASFVKSIYQFYNIFESKKKANNNNPVANDTNPSATTNASTTSTFDLINGSNDTNI